MAKVLLTTVGENTWTVPDGVTSLKIEFVGGGGGGGSRGTPTLRGPGGTAGGASELVGYATSAAPGRGGGGGSSFNSGAFPGAQGSPGEASSPGISGEAALSGSRNVDGLETYGSGGSGVRRAPGNSGGLGGSGGGGAYWVVENYSVTPGQELNFVVGGGGAGATRFGITADAGIVGVVRITYADNIAPSFSDDTGDAQSWVRNTVISSIPIPRVAQGAPTPAYTSSGVPAGITVALPTATADGSITGTPTSGVSGTITITATNASGSDAWTVAYNIMLDVSAPAFSDATGNAQTWSTGNTISDVVVPTASGTPTPAYAVQGSLPAGLSFNASTRTISGTPTSVGSGTITVRATNSEGSADWTAAYTITKLLSFPDDPAAIQDWSVGTAISDIVIPVAVGSITPTYAVVGRLPDGIAFDVGTRTLSGTPTTSVNVSTITVRATNAEARDDYGIRYLVRRANPTQTITLPVSGYSFSHGFLKEWTISSGHAIDFDLAPPGADRWFQVLQLLSNGTSQVLLADEGTGTQSVGHQNDDLSDQFESTGQFILQHGTNVLTLNMADTSDSDEPYTWTTLPAAAAFYRSIPSAGADITLTIRSKAPVVATLSASASTGVPLARAALVAAALSASVMAGVPTAQASLAPPTISMKASAGAPSASANLLPGQPPFDLSWTTERGRTVYVSAVITAGVPRGNGTVYEDQPGRTLLGSVLAGSDLESQTGQSVTAIALNELFTGNITFWDSPSPLAWSSFFTDNPDVSLWMQFAPSGPIYPFVSRGHGGSYSAWATADTAAQAAVTAARAEGARFAFVLRGAPAVTTLSASSTAGVPTGAANLQQPTLSTIISAGAPTARVNLQGQLLSATASAGVPTAAIDIEEQGVGINAYVPPSGYLPIVLAFLEADVSGVNITAEPTVTIGTGNDLIVASDLVISQVERHVAGSQIRLRRSGDGEFSTYFDNEGSPLYPDARLQIQRSDRSIIDGSIDNTGGGFNNWSVANSAQRSKLNAIATGERFVLAILKKVTIEASAGAIPPAARVALAPPLIAVDASAGEPTARVYFDSLPLSVSLTAGTPTARADLAPTILSISASAGTPIARAALVLPTISIKVSTGAPTAKASLVPPILSASASAATPTARAYLASLVLTTNDIDLTNLDVYALALINTGTPTGATGTIYNAATNLGSIDVGGDLTARSGQDITRIGLNPQGSGTLRFWDNPSEQSWTNFFSAYPRATLRLQFEIPGPAYELTRGAQGGNFSNWSTSNTAARAAIASARADGKKFIFLLAEERIAVRAGEGERGSVATAGTEGTGRKIDAATRSGSGEFGSSATEGVEGTGNSQTVTGLGEGEVGQVTASAIEGQGASVVIKRVGSGEFGRVVTVGMEGAGNSRTAGRLGEGEVGRVTTSAVEGQGTSIVIRKVGSGEFGKVIVAGAEGAGAKFIPLPAMGSGEFGSITTSGKEGVGRKNAAKTLSGTGEFGTVSLEGDEGTGRRGGDLTGFTKIAEVRGISFPRTGLEGDVSYDITLRSRDRTGNTGNLVSAGTVLTEDLLDVPGAEFVFQRNNTGIAPDPPISTEKQRKTDDYIPTGWSDNPQGVSVTNRYEYISSRTGSTGRWSEFGPPGLYDIFLVEGETEAQFIFRRTASASAPNTPRSSAAQRANDSYVPSQWTRGAQGTTETLPYEWASYRLGSSKNWSVFYPPTLREAHPTARGPIPFFRAISGSSWSNSEADLATTGSNVTGDRVTLYNSTAKWTATRVWSGSRWITIGKWIDGNLIVEGSILSIFDIIAGAAVKSSNYRAGVEGWRIAQDGDAEFNGALFAENLQNVRVLWQETAGIQVVNSKSITLNDSISNYDFLQGVCRATSKSWYMPWAIPTSKLSSSKVNLMGPSGLTGNDLVQFSIARAGSRRLTFTDNNHSDNRVHIYQVIGVKSPGGSVPTIPDTIVPDPSVPGTRVTANAGPDVSVESGGTAQIGGTDTIANSIGSTTYSWTRVSGTGGRLSSGSTTSQPTFTAPTVSSNRNIVWRKTTTNNGVSDTDDMTITVTPAATQAPGIPSTPSATTRGETSLTLSTTAGAGGAVTTYRWRYSTNSNVSDFDPEETSTGPSVTISGLARNTNYWIDVRAENSAGNSDYSGNLATSTLAAAAGATTVTANAGPNVSVESGDSVSIGGIDSVTSGIGTTTYGWERRSGTGGSLNSTRTAQPTFTAPTVSSNRTIVWRKTTTNNGVSDSDDVTITVTPAAIQAPGAPSTPRATEREETSLTLATTPGAGGAATGYRWRISTNSAVTNADTILTSSGPSITITGLNSNDNYWADVRAENSAGNSAYSGNLATSTTAGTTTDPDTPDPVGATTVTANAGSDRAVAAGSSVVIGGVDTIVNPVGATTIRWSKLTGGIGTLDDSTIASPTFTGGAYPLSQFPVVISLYRKSVTNNGVTDTDDISLRLVRASRGTRGTGFDVSWVSTVTLVESLAHLEIDSPAIIGDNYVSLIKIFPTGSSTAGDISVDFLSDLTDALRGTLTVSVTYDGVTLTSTKSGSDISSPYSWSPKDAAAWATMAQNMVDNLGTASITVSA